MQNTPQTFRGAGAPGVNFTDHTYDNHIGVHCQPTGYQPYTNPPYHPIPSPRPHHYANHQMQQNMPYRHHGGAYAPNQNQYGQNMNQEMYRNHHSGYVSGPNNRNMPAKSWSENNAPADLMPPYGQVSHPQMMNNPPQMPVNSMRSPPHATSNLNPTPPQNQQHFRQMQSPAHSPHSWSQAQIPSPGVMHSSRTTPSPLPAHVRSPGHSQQPFSPPAAHAINMPPHPQPPENGQIPSAINPTGGAENPSNPLHSLQKMVMLDQDPSKAILPMIGDGGEQFTNPCGTHNYLPDEGASNESKDSSYSTYYNMDENRFESKPNNTATDTAAYSTVQQVSNCNFPVPSHPLNSEEAKSTSVATNNNPSISEGLHSDHTSPSSNNSPSSAPLTQCKSNVGQNDLTLNLAECPPHAESAPVFTDQTQAAVSTNSEQALESKVSPNSASNVLPGDNETPAVDIPNSHVAGEPVSSDQGKAQLAKDSEVVDSPTIQIKCESTNQNEEISNIPSVSKENAHVPESPSVETGKLKNDEVNNSFQCKEEKCDTESADSEKYNSSLIKVQAEVHNSDVDTALICENNLSVSNVSKKETYDEDSLKKSTLRQRKVGASYEETPSPEAELKENENSVKIAKDSAVDSIKLSPKCDSSSADQDLCDSKPLKDLARNPVKVVIHRIRKNDTNDTWHVPGNNNESSCEVRDGDAPVDKKPETRIPNVGPQIIILSPAVSQKKFGFHSSVAANNVITVDEEDSGETVDKEESLSKSPNNGGSNNSPGTSSCGQSPDKKRGRPVGSKNKLKPGAVKKKKGRKGSKKKKCEQSNKSKVTEIPSKSKRVKIFSGPYVHIVGSKESPSSIKVINVAQKEEEKVNKIPTKRNFSSTVSRIKKKQVGHLSTLSPTYDAFNKDKTWLCVFCHKGSHHGGLGDLYGPYYIKDKNHENTKLSTPSASNSSGSGSTRRKRCKSEPDDSRSSKKSKLASGHTPIESTPVKSSQNDALSEADVADLREVWIHEDCAVWCQSISLIGEEVQGLEEAVTEAREHICCQCSLDGATLGCWGKCCKEQYHFSCAKDTGCQMDIENFSLLCPKHQKKSPERRTRCQ